MTTFVTHRPRPRRVLGALALLLALAVALGACAGLPQSGPVTSADTELPAGSEVSLFVPGPSPGAEPEEIVRGFLDAVTAGFGDDFGVAREFLAGPAVEDWRPGESTQIHVSSAPRVERTATGAVEVSVDAVATVDERGRYIQAPVDAVFDAEMSLARNAAGEWRIVDLPNGILLPEASFSLAYDSTYLHFLTPDDQYFVLETRWFPRENLATAATNALLAGPSEWLEPGVRTAAPSGTRLRVDSVPVGTDGVATVDLTSAVLEAEVSDRALLRAQIEATLATAGDVREVRLEVGQQAFDTGSSLPELSVYPYSTPSSWLAIADGELMQVSEGEATTHPGADLLGDELSSPATGYGEDPPSVVIDGGDNLVTVPDFQSPPSVLVEGRDLLAPSIDRFGWIWTITQEEDQDPQMIAIQATGERVDITAPWLAEGDVLALRISRDGSRAGLIREVAGEAVVEVVAVQRDAEGRPSQLADPVAVAQRLEDPSDLAWVGPTTLAVLATSDLEPSRAVHTVPLGAPHLALPVVEGAARITAGRGDTSLLVTTEDGTIFERNGATWRAAHVGLEDPALPG